MPSRKFDSRRGEPGYARLLPAPVMTAPTPPFAPQATRTTRTRSGLRVVTALRLWPEPACATQTGAGEWAPSVPWTSPVSPAEERAAWDPPLDSLRVGLPESLREAVQPLDSESLFPALRMVRQVPAAEGLLRECPCLGVWVATHLYGESAGEPDRARVQHLSTLPPRDVLEHLGLPGERWVLRVLRKLSPRAVLRPGIEALRGLFAEPADPAARRVRKLLRHLPRIGGQAALLCTWPDLLDSAHFDLLAEPEAEDSFCLVSALAVIAAARAEGTAPARPRRFRSRAEVAAFRMELAHFRDETWDPALFPERFDAPLGGGVLAGEPPVTSTPIRTAGELHEHGCREHLCIPHFAGYPTVAALGGGALYVLRWAEEEMHRLATAWVVLDREGVWRLRELRGTANKPPPTWLAHRVLSWLETFEGDDAPVEEPQEPGPRQLVLPLAFRWAPEDWDESASGRWFRPEA